MSQVNIFSILLSLFFILGIAGVLPTLNRPYDLPQFVSLCVVLVLLFARRLLCGVNRDRKEIWVLIGLCFAIGLTFWIVPPVPMSLMVLVSSIPLGILLCDLDLRARRRLRIWILGLAILQALLAVLSYLEFSLLPFRQHNSAPLGTIGNPDFLATVVAVGIFLTLRLRVKPFIKYSILTVLFLGLLASRSRGTLLVTAVLVLRPYFSPLTWRLLFAGAFGLGIVFWKHFLGRVQMWLVSVMAIVDRPWSGWGWDQFSSAYFDTNLRLMTKSAWFQDLFGPWSSQVSDAHNVILQWGVSFGLPGMVVSGSIFFYTVRQFRPGSLRTDVAALVTIKSLYTVVLSTLQAVGLGSFVYSLRYRTRSRNLVWTQQLFIGALIGLIVKTAVVEVVSDYYLSSALERLKIGLAEDALELVERGRAFRADHPDLLLAGAFALMKLNRCQESDRRVQQVISRERGMDTFKRGSHILYDCGLYSRAMELLLPLSVVFPEHRTTSMKIAWSSYHLGDYKTAEMRARTVLRQTPRRKSSSDQRNLAQASRLLQVLEEQ